MSDLPDGPWPSPITPSRLARRLRLGDVQWDSDGATLIWHEGRGAGGMLVAASGDDVARDLTEHGVRARLGYGGGEFAVAQGQLFYAGPGGRLYRQALSSGAAHPITPAFGAAASPTPSPDGRWLLYVHSDEGVDRLAIVDATGSGWPQELVGGDDFYMQPAWHPSGRLVAWVSWNQPQMPWDGTTLWIGELDAGGSLPRLVNRRQVAGGPDVAVQQPRWAPDGRLLAYLSDENGWSQIFLCDQEGGQRQLTEGRFEVGGPAWVQGLRHFDWSGDSRHLSYIRNADGFASLWQADLATGESRLVPGLDDYTWLEQPAVHGHRIAVVASSSTLPPRVLVLEPGSAARVARYSDDAQESPEAFSQPQAVQWQAPDSTSVYGLYYPPVGNTLHAGEQPPAVVRVHGGPTDQAVAEWDGGTQFLATRGIAVLQVNHRGSTGYGREYMTRLYGTWGLVDAEDAAGGAAFLAAQGLADPARLVVMGGSAGGLTVLNSLIRHPGRFKAGICLYPVTDLLGFGAETHKFEARYLERIVGPLPEATMAYRERSPVLHADRLVDPLAMFQGADDQVVPQAQSEAIVASLRQRGLPHEYHLYAGEGHGWRKPETIAAYWNAVEQFLQRYVLGA